MDKDDVRTEPEDEETEEQAIAAIEKLGGEVHRLDDTPGMPVVDVVLEGTNITDGDMVRLRPWRTLQYLYLSGTLIGNPGLVHL